MVEKPKPKPSEITHEAVEIPLPRNLANASFERPVVLVHSKDVAKAMEKKVERLSTEFHLNNALVMPIMRGGGPVGQYLSDRLSISMLPFRMSYYDEQNQRRPEPELIDPPDLGALITMLNEIEPEERFTIILAEAVVDSGKTIQKAEELLRPLLSSAFNAHGVVFEFRTEALVDKSTSGDNLPSHVFAEFHLHKDVWVRGYGCDDQGVGRDDLHLSGRWSPYR